MALREGLMYCLTKTDRHAIIADGVARYILPVEAERLQGLPDDYTKVPYRGLPAEKCPGALRYEVVGNAMPIPVMRWVGERIAFVDSAHAASTNGSTSSCPRSRPIFGGRCAPNW
jgi:site-specific DNA-cytosine methylase